MRIFIGLLASFLLLVSSGRDVAAQENFYAGKTVNIVVGFGAGGGIDAYARLLARHLGRNIPGNPTVIVQNMPGAAGLTAVMSLNTPTGMEGLNIVAFNPALAVQALLTPDKIKVDFSQLQWLGAIDTDQKVCYMWAATGVKTFDEMRKRNQTIVGGAGAGAASIEEKILTNIFGVKLKEIEGYTGSNDTHLALERGELEGLCGAWTAIAPDWIRDKKVNILIRFQKDVSKGLPASVPYAGDLVTDPDKKKLLDLATAGSSLGRPYILSKDLPADRVKLLRDAFDKTMKDPQFLADVAKAGDSVSPASGTQLQGIVKDLYAAPPAVLDAARSLLGSN